MLPRNYNPQQSSSGVFLQGSSPSIQGSAPRLQGGSGLSVQSLPSNLIGLSGNISQPRSTQTQTSSTSSPTAPGQGGGVGAQTALTLAAIEQALKGLGAFDTQLNTGYRNIDDQYNSIRGGYQNEGARAQRDFDENVFNNESNLERNNQTALVAGAQGARGLRGVLASLGALGGTGTVLADRAVRDTTNQDLGGAKDTFDTNYRGLSKAKEDFDEDQKRRMAELDTQRVNQRTALERGVLSDRQSALQKLAELYGQAGNNPLATQRLREAGDLSEQIAQKGAVQATPFSRTSAKFNPGELSTYAAGRGDMTVRTSGGNQTPGGVPALSSLTASRNREEDRV